MAADDGAPISTRGPYVRPPADGERSAVAGLFPQYEVAAGLLLRALTEERLEWVAILDPEAGRLDDFQLATYGLLDAYQIKWTIAGGQMSWGEIRDNLADIVRDREGLAALHGDRRVVAHLYSDRVASSSPARGVPGMGEFTPARAVAELIRPATGGAFASPDAIPAEWRPLWKSLADDLALGEADLLARFPLVRLELGRRLPTADGSPGREDEAYRKDVRELRGALQDAAIDPKRVVRMERDELLGRLPASWRERMELVSVHEFERPIAYEPIASTVDELHRAIDVNLSGYVALVGAPGSGKSTLLSEELRHRDDVVARYYAYVRGRADLGAIRSDAAAFLHDLVLTLERRDLPRGPAPVDFDVPTLNARLGRHLQELGARYRESGERAIVMVDGLDHVEREGDPAQSLLRYLPRPEELPEGVLFVVGSQTTRMVHPDIRTQLEDGGRTVAMRGLDGAAIARIADRWGIDVGRERLRAVTGGHPLLLDYVLRELAGIDAREHARRLDTMPAYGGDVLLLYNRLWGAIEDDDELVELLGLVSRIRVAIDLAWLMDGTQSPAVVRRMRETLAHLFRREGGRWHFFHQSFRLFLQERTATIAGEGGPEPEEDRRYHAQLAAMCDASGSAHPMWWEALFHLAAADRHAEVLDRCKPELFRSQLLALRPPELIAADIRMAACSLAAVQDPMALVRLMIAAGELSQREYLFPDRDELVDILLDIGRWRTVVDLMAAERDHPGAGDGRTLRLKVAGRLHRMGHVEEARRLFVANEPLDLLAGRRPLRPRDAPFQLLYQWARVAVVIRGADAVLAAAATIQLRADDVIGLAGDEDRTPGVRAWMLAAASDTAHAVGRFDDSDRVLSGLDPSDPVQRGPWARCLLGRWRRGNEVEAVDRLVTSLRPPDLDDDHRIQVAGALLATGRRDAAREWTDGLAQPPIADPRSLGDLWSEERDRYEFSRLRSALGERPAPDDVIPAPVPNYDHSWGYVHVARTVVAVAQLDGMADAGEPLDPYAFMARAHPILRLLDLRGGDWSVRTTLQGVRARAVASLLDVAAKHGTDVAEALWREIEARWQERPGLLGGEGGEVLPVAVRAGVAARSRALEHLMELEEVVKADATSQGLARDLADVAKVALTLAAPETASRLLEESVATTLAVYERKDYQLTDWIELMRPRLEQPDGKTLAGWLAGALRDLEREASGRQVTDAAEALLAGESRRRPGHAWRLGAWLEDAKVVDRDDRATWLLEATADSAADGLWWIVLVDATVPIATKALRAEPLLAAARTGTDRELLERALTRLIRRSRVEGPPRSRASWAEAVADVASELGIEMRQVGLPDELHPANRPPRSRVRGTDEEQRDAFLAAHDTVDAVIAAAADERRAQNAYEWSEALELVSPRMDSEQLKAAMTAVGDDGRLEDLLTLARRASQLGDTALAETLAERALVRGESSGWRRHYDGGTVLSAMTILFAGDPARTRDRAYRRLAADASSDPYLLSEMARALGDYVELFGMHDQLALAEEVEAYVRVLIPDPQEQPPADAAGDDADGQQVLARILIDLLRSPYRLAITTAQRAVVAGLETRDPDLSSLVETCLREGDEEEALRLISVVDSVAGGGAAASDAVLDALEGWAASGDLALREGARGVLRDAGRALTPIPARPLAAAYRLVVPATEQPAGLELSTPLGRDDLDATIVAAGGSLADLADIAGLDGDLVENRVAVLARRLADGRPVDDSIYQTSDSALGWSYHKPSMALWERAALQVAAEIVDAGLISADRALRQVSGRAYDPALIRDGPGVQPATVPSAMVGHDERWVSPDSWMDGLDLAASRLARSPDDDWLVIGEYTDVRYLDREMPRERRWQGLDGQGRHPRARPDAVRPVRVAELDDLGVRSAATPLVTQLAFGYRGPSAWLTMHPALARACGLRRGEGGGPFEFSDDSGVAVRSIWWRSGWLDAARWAGHDEVGEGWLVLVAPRVVPQLERLLGGPPVVAWEVVRDFLNPSESRRDGRSGVRDILD